MKRATRHLIDITPENKPTKTAEIVSCSPEELEHHIRAFIEVFVAPEAKDRWMEFLIEKYPKWAPLPNNRISFKLLGKAAEVLKSCKLDPRYCTNIPSRIRTLEWQETIFHGLHGVYFDLNIAPCKMNVASAVSRFNTNDDSAILSAVPGKLAMLFSHGCGVWLCIKN